MAAGSSGPSPGASESAEGFRIPPLVGNAPRPYPAQVTWWIDAALGSKPDTMARLRRELPAVLEYERRYAVAEDTLAVGNRVPSPVSDVRLAGLAAQPVAMTWGAQKSLSFMRARTVPKGSVGIDIVLTDRPEAWRPLLATSARPGAGSGPAFYLIDTALAGLTPKELADAGPWLLPGGSRRAGSVATSVARAWAHGVHGAWTG